MEDKKEYYRANKILSLKDINGEEPEIYMVDGNKTAGKTTSFLRIFISRWLEHKEQFVYYFRYREELQNCGETIFNDVAANFFPEMTYGSGSKNNGLYHELIINDEVAGFAVPLNSASKFKRLSHMFNKVQRIFFDEFQEESGQYCPDELTKFFTMHTCIARGFGQTRRRVPIYMCSNGVSLLNPYYTQFGVTTRLKDDTKFLRGNGWVLERCFNPHAAKAIAESGVAKAFNGNKSVDYATQNIYLRDDKIFVEKPTGRGRYICTLKYKGNNYGVLEYAQNGIMYVSNTADMSHPIKFSVTLEDHAPNYVALNAMGPYIQLFRKYFDNGVFRFESLTAKEALLFAICYR